MDAVHTYINVLVDSLEKKKTVLEQILELTEEQKILLQQESFDEEKFNKTMDAKDTFLKELEHLDQGFEQIYEKVSLTLKHNKDLYKTEILTAQGYIKVIMDLSISIRALEEQNKTRFPICLMKKRDQIRNFKVTNRVATSYYRNMPNIHQEGQSYFLDRKK